MISLAEVALKFHGLPGEAWAYWKIWKKLPSGFNGVQTGFAKFDLQFESNCKGEIPHATHHSGTATAATATAPGAFSQATLSWAS